MDNAPIITKFKKALPGHFYAVGVGPGSSDLLTLRAVELIKSADVLIAPRSRNAKESLALQTVKDFIDNQEVVDHVYAMTRNVEKTIQLWREMAKLTHQRCSENKSVVQITLGDPLIYSTSCYLLGLVRELLPAENVHVVPGISAFQATACMFEQPLTIQEDRMTLMSATDMGRVEQALGSCETLVLYKAGKRIGELSELLKRHGLLDRARLVCYAEQGDRQFVSSDIQAAAQQDHGYMATVIVYVGRHGWDDQKDSCK